MLGFLINFERGKIAEERAGISNWFSDNKKNVLIALITPITLLICLWVKWYMRTETNYMTPIFESNLVNIMYIKHYCDYLELQNGIIAWGRVFVMISMALTFYLNMFECDFVKSSYAVIMTNVIFVISTFVINAALKPVGADILAKFIIQIVFWTVMFFVFNTKEILNNNFLKILFAVYLGANIGNMLEANVIGWVTDYVWLLPAYGKQLVYNIEDFIIIGTYGILAIMGLIWLIKTLKAMEKEKRQSEVGKVE